MNNRELENSIAYCGLVCKLCHLAGTCNGCKITETNCGKYLSQEGCYHRDCCTQKNIDGCWECDEYPCARDMFIGKTKGEILGFCTCIKEQGKRKFIEYLVQNMKAGIKYGIESYGDLNAKQVLELLKHGKVTKKG
ncbi:MAG: DUF3795 domain-containing protein [Spirochaetales bacterium]|nr:DUF3795 domain-containing protein [Spirochaetales bacterium]